MRGKQSNIFASLDWGVLTVYFLLVFLGISNIYAAVYDPDHAGLFDLETEHGKQIMWFGVSLFLGLIILFLEGNFIRKYAYWIYGGTIFLLIAVLFTSPINVARSWFGF